MSKETGVQMPSGFGGLVRYKEEFGSKFTLKPTHVIAFVLAIIGLRIVLPMVI